MTRDEFIAQQRAEAEKLRNRILEDTTAKPALQVLAADADETIASRAVLDDDRLAPHLGEAWRHGTRDQIGTTTGRIRRDQTHRLVGKCRSGCARSKQYQCGQIPHAPH